MANLLAAAEAGSPRALNHWWPDPPPRAANRVTLERVVLRTPSVDGAYAFYTHVLGGTADGSCRQGCRISWPGGAEIALESVSGSEPGIDRFELSGDPPGERLIGGARFVFGG
jgi:hypothetical protein